MRKRVKKPHQWEKVHISRFHKKSMENIPKKYSKKNARKKSSVANSSGMPYE